MILRVLCHQCGLPRTIKTRPFYFYYVSAFTQQNVHFSGNVIQRHNLLSICHSSLITRSVDLKSLSASLTLQQKYKYTDDAKSYSNIEKRLIVLMDEWEVEKAVKLLKKTIAVGDIPDRTVVLNLIQLIANLGEYELLVELHDILAVNVITSKNFYKCLNEAYYKSGRVAEGVAHLRILYHKTRKYKNVDIFFVLISVMILRNFPQLMYLINDFVEECEEMEDSLPGAGLWKTCMIMSKFEDADKLILKNDKIIPSLTQMTMDLLHSKHDVEMDKKAVLLKLCQVVSLEDKVRTTVYLHLIHLLCSEQCWTEFQLVLCEAKKIFLSNISLPDEEEKLIHQILKDLQDKEKQASPSERTIIIDCIDELNNLQFALKQNIQQ